MEAARAAGVGSYYLISKRETLNTDFCGEGQVLKRMQKEDPAFKGYFLNLADLIEKVLSNEKQNPSSRE